MLIRTSKVADELSASVQVRGMKLGGAYSSYRKAEIGGRDIGNSRCCFDHNSRYYFSEGLAC